MAYFKINLKLLSPLGTPLMADTLFGHLCWGIALHEGSTAIREFLEAMRQSPPLLISDPFPAGYWPAPTVPMSRADKDTIEKSGADRKAFARIAWIPEAIFRKLVSDLSWSAYHELALAKVPAEPPAFIEAALARVTVNRLSNASLEESGLFFDSRIYPKIPGGDFPRFEVYILSSYPPERIRQLFDWAVEAGYGKDSSIGLGNLVVEEIHPVELPAAADPNAMMTLGACVPKHDDPVRGFWRVEPKFGKLGGPWATGGDDTDRHPFKFPLTFIRTGAVFAAPPKPFVGRMVDGIHPTRREVVQYGYALALPVRVPESLMSELEEPVSHASKC